MYVSANNIACEPAEDTRISSRLVHKIGKPGFALRNVEANGHTKIMPQADGSAAWQSVQEFQFRWSAGITQTAYCLKQKS